MGKLVSFAQPYKNIPNRIIRDRLVCMDEQQAYITAIRRLMASREWNQGELATRAGVMPNTITDALNPDRQPRITTLILIARAFNVPLWALFCSELEYGAFTDRGHRAEVAQQLQQLMPRMIDMAMDATATAHAPRPDAPAQRRGRNKVK